MLRIIIREMSSSPEKIRTPILVFGIAGRYVTALYRASIKMKQLNEVEKHLGALKDELIKPKVKDFLVTNIISRADKAMVLKQVGKDAGMPEAAINFLAVVAEFGRLKLLRRMIKLFLTVMVAHKKEALCEIITAEPLDDKSRKALVEALHKFLKGSKKINLSEKVDPDIMGGIIVGIEDKHIDLSIASRVKKFSLLIKEPV